MQEAVDELEQAGKTAVLMAVDGQVAAALAVADTVKEHSAEAIKDLRESGIEVWMITGDNRRTAEAIARQVGIENVLAEVLPEDKAREIKRLRDQGRVVAMVGMGSTMPRHWLLLMWNSGWYRHRCGYGGGRHNPDARGPAVDSDCHSPEPGYHAQHKAKPVLGIHLQHHRDSRGSRGVSEPGYRRGGYGFELDICSFKCPATEKGEVGINRMVLRSSGGGPSRDR
jgi:hypothetical protein